MPIRDSKILFIHEAGSTCVRGGGKYRRSLYRKYLETMPGHFIKLNKFTIIIILKFRMGEAFLIFFMFMKVF